MRLEYKTGEPSDGITGRVKQMSNVNRNEYPGKLSSSATCVHKLRKGVYLNVDRRGTPRKTD